MSMIEQILARGVPEAHLEGRVRAATPSSLVAPDFLFTPGARGEELGLLHFPAPENRSPPSELERRRRREAAADLTLCQT